MAELTRLISELVACCGRYRLRSSFSGQPVVKNGRVYIGSEDGTLLALDEATGRLLWRYRTKGAIHGPVAVNDKYVFFGSGDGYVYAVSSDKGRMKWQQTNGRRS